MAAIAGDHRAACLRRGQEGDAGGQGRGVAFSRAVRRQEAACGLAQTPLPRQVACMQQPEGG